jgi:hypothetical protein
MKVRRVLGTILGVILLTAVALSIWGVAAVARGRARIESRIAELRAGTRCTARVRVPRGTPVPDDAWVHYERAIELSTFSPDDVAFLHQAGVPVEIDLDRVRRILASHPRAFEELALGARSSGLGAPDQRSFDEGVRLGTLEVNLAWLCFEQSHQLLREGRPRAAAEPLLDLTRWCLDREERGRNDRTMTPVWSTFDGLFPILVEIVRHPSLSRQDATDLEQQIETLDRGFPCYLASIEQAVASVGEMLLDDKDALRETVGDAADRRSWRTLFSTALLRQAAFFQYDSELRQIAPLHEGPYHELANTCDGLVLQNAQSRNAILSTFALLDLFSNYLAREAHTRIRLLRLACAWRARGKLPELPDPLGTTLHHSEGEEGVVLWIGEQDRRDARVLIELKK